MHRLARRRSAGARPNAEPATIETIARRSRRACRRPAVDNAGIRGAMRRGMTPTSECTPNCDSNRPSAPPPTESSRLSVSSWRTRRPRPAPSATRTAISRCAVGAAHEQKVRDVRARDEQHDRDRAVEHKQQRPNRADELVAQGNDLRVSTGVGLRILTRQIVHDARHVADADASVAPARSRATTLSQ